MTLEKQSIYQPKRNHSVDFMKSILVILMMMAHVVQFFPCGKIAGVFSTYVNLTTFSGFMFTFGFVCYTAYIEKSADIILVNKLFRKMLKTIVAFYLFGIAYTVLVSHHFSLTGIVKIIALQKIPGYSEFLLSFAFIYPLIFVWVLIKQRIKHWHLAFMFVVSLVLTLIDYSKIHIPVIGVFLGTNSFACFPIIQYSSYFLAGIYLSSTHRIIDKNVLVISVIGTFYFLGFCFTNHHLPNRFPPTACWIMGGYAFVYLYFIICNKISEHLLRFKRLIEIGRHSLVFLVISNIVIFMMSNFKTYYLSYPRLIKLLFCSIVFFLCFLFSFLWLKVSRMILHNRTKTQTDAVLIPFATNKSNQPHH